jgi:hypothetical protein
MITLNNNIEKLSWSSGTKLWRLSEVTQDQAMKVLKTIRGCSSLEAETLQSMVFSDSETLDCSTMIKYNDSTNVEEQND